MYPSHRRFFTALVLTSVLICAEHAAAQYHDAAAVGERLAAIARQQPRRVAVRSLARTREGRDVWLATIGEGAADARPAVLIVGGIDGASVAGSELALRFIEAIASDASDSTRQLLERVTFYVIPRASPDAIEAFFARPRAPRNGNSTPYDNDRDGAIDEDGYEDLNGDGLITQMRVQSALGRYIAHTGDARLMIDADASRGERGAYELYSEGRDNDNDGAVNEDPIGGVDINRNFTYNYQAFGPASGEHAASEVETRAIADFCYDHQNIALVFSYSAQANLLHPWEARADAKTGAGGRIVRTVREGDDDHLARIARIYTEITGLKGGRPYVKGEGSFAEWAYYHYGRFSISTPGWLVSIAKDDRDTTAAKANGTKTSRDDRLSIADTVAWFEHNGMSGASTAWTRVEHPDYPGRIVEVGGLASFATSEPPPSMLDSLGRLHTLFIRRVAGLLPRIQLADVRTEPLGDGLTRVLATVVNTGYLPTLAAMGETSRVPIDVKVELKLQSGQSVVSGRRVQLLGPIAGSGGSKALSWVIAGSGSTVISAVGPMAGSAEHTVRLGR